MDSSVSPTYGEQEDSLWNGHFGCTCYHPLFVFNQFGDLERGSLRPGNVHSADGWEEVLGPVVARYQASGEHIAFRGDAAFAQPSMYEYLEAEGIDYAIRLPANQILQGRIADLLKRPVGRPPHYVQRFYRSFRYKAKSWSHSRRVVAKVEWHPGELFPRVGFVITNLTVSGKNVVRFYNQRGTAEQWIKEGKGAIKWTRLSCRSFKQTPFAYNFTRSRIIWGTSFARLRRRTRSRTGPHEPAGKAHQDRCEGRQPRSLRNVSDGGSGDPAGLIRLPYAAHCRVALPADRIGSMNARLHARVGKYDGRFAP